MRVILILACLATYASAQSLSTNFQKPITVPLAPGMRPNSSNLAIDYGAKTGAQPTQVHLAIAGPTSVYVIWATENYTVAQGAPTPMDVSKTYSLVMYGSSASNLTLNASGITEVYTQVYNTTQAGIGGMNYSSPYMHTVILANLTPGTQYFYQVGDGTTFSGVYNFTTLLPPGQTYPQRLVWIADAGTSQNASTTIDHTVASLYGSNIGKAPVTFYVGDFSYADHWFPNGTQSNPIVTLSGVTSASFQPVWDLFQRMFEPLFSAAPTMFTVGNHEIEQQQDANYTMWKSIQTRWKAPNGTSNSFFYYSIEFGPVHFITISPYADYSVGSAQWNWLAQDLLSVNRTLTPWVFVEFHNPWYTTGGDYKGVEQMRIAMEPLLVQAGVDAVFNGHVHAYERIYPVNNFVLDPCGVNHYTIGDGGNDGGLSFLAANNVDPQYEDTNGGCPNVTSSRPKYFVSLAPSVTDPFSYWKNSYTFQADGNSTGVGNPKGYCYSSQPQWSAYREPSFGHGTVDVVNATHALWQWNRNQDSVAIAADATWIIRNTTQCMNKMYPNMRSTNGAMMTATS